ncbi:MAG: response regulator [Oscillospiraceae bacterium]|nr:response regulator [Oscillospiraceae bacterium]
MLIEEGQKIPFDIAINTNQGIELLHENKYDLIITDMGRGRESDAGLKLMQKINQLKTGNTPPVVVFASRRAIDNYGAIALEMGAVATVNGMAEIISLISKILEKE